MRTILGIIFGLLTFPSTGTGLDEATDIDFRQVHCLAHNIYFEASNQGTAGMFGVGQVTLNRVKSKKYPNTICEVVYQAEYRINWKGNRVPVLNRCQFSWYCDGKTETIRYPKDYDEAYIMAELLIEDRLVDITEGALFYHADYVSPKWAKNMTQKIKIGDHIFY